MSEAGAGANAESGSAGAELVAAHGLEFAYGRKSALLDFDLQVARGEILLLIGLNGAGKSTALSLLAGERKPRQGQVRVLGHDPRKARARRHLWLLKEVACPAPHLSAVESVRFHLDLYGRGGPWREKVTSCLEHVGLGDAARQRASTYSKGMARRLEIACLLATDPDVWLLDEPQAGLDPKGMRLLREVCTEARDRGRGLVIASHALGDIPALADRVLVLRDGRTVFNGDRDALMAKVGARGWIVEDGGDEFDAALRDLAKQHRVGLSGPAVPAGPLEDLLFRGEGPSGVEGPAK
ncbi:MAG: copper ABC transporter ATP-binding protein [Planctomycetes bacterium]|nr:copper ABC transporter ATP-binding protein [Planctomycetota bacterium]